MNSVSASYAGREHSYIKHCFLTEYVRAAAYKTLQGRSNIFNFVDAFAGPWRVSDQHDYSDASFDQALRTLEAVRGDLGRKGHGGLRIRLLVCEKRKDAVEQLRSYARNNRSVDIMIFEGPFEENLGSIASACGEGFTFTFIDPTGWNINSAPIFEFLRDRNGEFLLNFMAEHINRHAEYDQVSQSFGRFLADPEWSAEYDALPQQLTNEERVLHILKAKLKSSKAAIYVPDFPILKPTENRIKMRLLLGTNSAKGLEVFRYAQWVVERKEIETRDGLIHSTSSQPSFFSDDEIVAMQQSAAGMGCPRYKEEARTRIIGLLTSGGTTKFETLAFELLESVPIRSTQLKDLLGEMLHRREVEYELPPRARKAQPATPISLGIASR